MLAFNTRMYDKMRVNICSLSKISNKVSFADQSVEERCDASDILYNLLWIASVSIIVKSKLCESRVTMQTDSRTAQVQD